jgi:diguanylate cyclase (GGDEF)-like protein
MVLAMTTAESSIAHSDQWGSFEPYAQLIKSLLPRASSVSVFDSNAELRWSSATTMGPDLVHLVESALAEIQQEYAEKKQDAGLLRQLDDQSVVYLLPLGDDHETLVAVAAIISRAKENIQKDSKGFSLMQSLLRPALECMRRDLLARSAITNLNHQVTALDKDLELLLADPTTRSSSADGAHELKSLLQQATDHLRCTMAALFVPDKAIVLMHTESGSVADKQLVAKTHRQLLSMAQMRREPVIINKLSQANQAGAVPYRILSCPLQHVSGRNMGVLALYRLENAPEFVPRDARLVDILARKAASVIESNYDALSGLYTRPAFEQRMRSVVNNPARNTDWCALYIDSDQLHVVNDNFGMHIGDHVIGQLGELIRRRLPPSAFAARISGDRFAVFLPTNLEAAAQFSESLREGAEQLGAPLGQARAHVSISIGVAPLEADVKEMMHCLAAAETACKAAKDRGRNRVELYQANDQSIIRRFDDINIGTKLREAIEAGRLRLDAQLILPFNAGSEQNKPHYELLLRMIGEKGETIGPDRFLSAANRYQLMPAIDRWVVDKTIELLKPHVELLQSSNFVFAINFSGQSLSDEEFSDFLASRIEGSGLPPTIFCFEITENATIANIARAEVLMRKLRRLGCGVALDDFGTGLSSLAYLRQLPVTLLKIDGSFVRDILTDPRSESMVRAIAQLAHGMNIGTVAEYVETPELRTRLATLGVDYGQGFAIGKPQPFINLLHELPLLAAAAPVSFERITGLPLAATAVSH